MSNPTKLRKEGNRIIRSILSNYSYDVVLNLGCGIDSDKEGGFYSKYFNSSKVIKIDPRLELKDRLDFVGTGENISIEDGKISMSFLNWVFVPDDPSVNIDIERTLKELYRVSHKGAEVIISYADHTENSDNNLEYVKRLISRYFDIINLYEFKTKDDKYCGNMVDWSAQIYHGKKREINRVFIDAGGYDGCSVRCFRKNHDPYEDFFIYSFEANDMFKDNYRDFKKHKFMHAAIWKYNGEIDFFLDQKKGYGSSVMKSKTTGNLDKEHPKKVKSIDLSDFIFKNIKKDDLLYLKLDIEGAEYEVIKHLFDTGAIQYVDRLFVEWHWKKVGVSESDHNLLVDKLIEIGLYPVEWDAIGY